MSNYTEVAPAPDRPQPVSGRSEWADLASEAVEAAVKGGRSVLNAYARVLRGLSSTREKPCVPECTIPETECPPYCVCDMAWEAKRGEDLLGTITVTNTGRQARQFTFEATSFQGSAGDSGIKPGLAPASALLESGESVVIRVALHVEDAFETSEEYTSQVKIRGAYEQCVRLKLKVQPRQRPHCDVRQGEIPTRIRAHHWYTHFQCEEPCFEPALQPLQPKVP